jgi:hypothetical protein
MQRSVVQSLKSLHCVLDVQIGVFVQQPLLQTSLVQMLPSSQEAPAAQQMLPMQRGVLSQQPSPAQKSFVQASPSLHTVPSAQQTSPGHRGLLSQQPSAPQLSSVHALKSLQSRALVQIGVLVQQPSSHSSIVHGSPSSQDAPPAQQMLPTHSGVVSQQPGAAQVSIVQGSRSLHGVPSAQQTSPGAHSGDESQHPSGPQASTVQALPSLQGVPVAQQTSPGHRGVFPQQELMQVGRKQALGTEQSAGLTQSGSKVQLGGVVAVRLTQMSCVHALPSTQGSCVVDAENVTVFTTPEQPDVPGASHRSRMRTLARSSSGSGSPGWIT